jgi:hypothetical protein
LILWLFGSLIFINNIKYTIYIMESLGGAINEYSNKQTFISHVFSSTEEGKAEIYNAVQYGITAIVPIVILNKLVQRFIPDPDFEKGSVEILAEIIIQLVVLFVGIILIHRIITFIPTFSKFKYEGLTITNVILAFLIIVLSLQTKIGIKTNILYERVMELWEGTGGNERKQQVKKGVRVTEGMMSGGGGHNASQADNLDNSPSGMFPPSPISPMNAGGGGGGMMSSRQQQPADIYQIPDPQPANFMGSPFGSSF